MKSNIFSVSASSFIKEKQSDMKKGAHLFQFMTYIFGSHFQSSFSFVYKEGVISTPA